MRRQRQLWSMGWKTVKRNTSSCVIPRTMMPDAAEIEAGVQVLFWDYDTVHGYRLYEGMLVDHEDSSPRYYRVSNLGGTSSVWVAASFLLALDTRGMKEEAAKMELRPYQRAAIDALMRGWDGGDNRQAVVLPTGSGKSIVFSHLIFEMRKYGARRSLVIAHREELLDQAADKIKRVAPHLKVGVYQGSRKQHQGKDVVVASVQTLGYRRPCLNKIVNEDGSVRTRCGECGRCNTLVNAREVGDFDLIIVDECFPAGTTV